MWLFVQTVRFPIPLKLRCTLEDFRSCWRTWSSGFFLHVAPVVLQNMHTKYWDILQFKYADDIVCNATFVLNYLKKCNREAFSLVVSELCIYRGINCISESLLVDTFLLFLAGFDIIYPEVPRLNIIVIKDGHLSLFMCICLCFLWKSRSTNKTRQMVIFAKPYGEGHLSFLLIK